MSRSFFIILFTFFANICLAQGYPGIVTLSDINDRGAVFTTTGVAEKKSDVELNALQSLFHTLFYVGVDGINDGKPLVVNDKPSYVSNFMSYKVPMYSSNRSVIKEPSKNISKNFEGVYMVKVPIASLLKELTLNGLCEATKSDTELVNITSTKLMLPSIIVVPNKKDGESYDAILQSDFDRRTAVAKVQSGFDSRNITTIDIQAKINAMKRRSEYEASTADSNDKQLLMSSGADVYVDVDLEKEIDNVAGSRVKLILKAYELSTGNILASSVEPSVRKYKTTAIDALCAYAVSDILDTFLDKITKKFNEQLTIAKSVVVQFSISENSTTAFSDPVGKDNYRLSDVIRSWIRANSEKFHSQGLVDESLIYDNVMIPPTDKNGNVMDNVEFEFMLYSYLSREIGIACSSKIDGNTIYITIE